jgi:curved DNA-binding protein CbpA
MDLYKVLGLDRAATQAEIKIAYKKLSMTLHPDRGGSEQAFKEINEAYSTLSDIDKRKQYDTYGKLNVPNNEILAKQNIAAFFLKLVETNEPMGEMDYILIIKSNVEQSINMKNSQIIEAQNKVELIKKRSKRIIMKDPDSFVAVAIRDRIKSLEDVIPKILESLEVENLILELLKDYQFQPDPVVPSQSSYIPTSTIIHYNNIG